MSASEQVRILSTLTTRDEAGVHFASRLSREEIDDLEAAGLIDVKRPIHEATGIPYGEEYWTVEVTAEGVELVEAYPEDCATA